MLGDVMLGFEFFFVMLSDSNVNAVVLSVVMVSVIMLGVAFLLLCWVSLC
jgi:hypothetical protein